MAWEAKAKFLRDSNPFRSAEPEKPSKKAVARDLRMGLRVASMSRKNE